MFVPYTVGQDPNSPLLSQIEEETAVLTKYNAVPMRVAQTLAINAMEQWSSVTFWGGLALGVGGVLLLQWLGTSIVGVVRDAANDPSVIAEKVVKKLQGKSKK